MASLWRVQDRVLIKIMVKSLSRGRERSRWDRMYLAIFSPCEESFHVFAAKLPR